jgi:hypothetical protein
MGMVSHSGSTTIICCSRSLRSLARAGHLGHSAQWRSNKELVVTIGSLLLVKVTYLESEGACSEPGPDSRTTCSVPCPCNQATARGNWAADGCWRSCRPLFESTLRSI